MIDLKAQLREYQRQLDELYPAPSTAEVQRSASHQGWSKPIHRRRHLAVFGLAFVLVLAMGAVGTLLLFAGADGPPAGVDPATTVTLPTTLPPSTGSPETVDTTVGEPVNSTTLLPSSALFSTPPTTRGSQATPGVIPLGGSNWAGGFVRGVVDSEQRPVFVHWDGRSGSILVTRCTDPSCSDYTQGPLIELPTALIEGEQQPPLIDDVALTADGSLVAMVWTADQTEHLLYACADAVCSTVATGQIGLEFVPSHPQIAIAADGSLRVVHTNPEQKSIDLMICSDLLCDAAGRSVVTIESGAYPIVDPNIRTDDEGRLFIGYTAGAADRSVTTAVVVCDDDRCSGEPIRYEVENGFDPQTTPLGDGRLRIWYRQGPTWLPEGSPDFDAILSSWKIVTVECGDGSCGPEVAFDSGWPVLFTWGQGATAALDTDRLAAVGEYWDPSVCSMGTDVVVFDVAAPDETLTFTLDPGGQPILLNERMGSGLDVWYLDWESASIELRTLEHEMSAEANDVDCS